MPENIRSTTNIAETFIVNKIELLALYYNIQS